MKVGDLVKSKYTGVPAHARIGVIIKLRKGAFEDKPLIQVFWPHRDGQSGWVDSKNLEVINESW